MADTAIRGAGAVTAPAADTRRRVRRLAPGKRVPFARGVGPVVLLGLWSLGSATGRLDPRVLPAPWSVVDTGWQLWHAGTLGPDLAISLQRAAEGFAIGLAAGVVCYISAVHVKKMFGYDDALDAWGVHGVGGALGALLTGVFASKLINPTGAPKGEIGRAHV